MNVNKVILIGNLGRDPKMTVTSGGKSVCTMTVATSHKGGSGDSTEWHRVVAWGKVAEICGQYLAKGRQVYVEGHLRTRTYEGKDGIKGRVTEVMAHRVVFLGGGGRRRPSTPGSCPMRAQCCPGVLRGLPWRRWPQQGAKGAKGAKGANPPRVHAW